MALEIDIPRPGGSDVQTDDELDDFIREHVESAYHPCGTARMGRADDEFAVVDPTADSGRGALVPKKVTRIFRNTTEEWIKLSWTEDGEQKELAIGAAWATCGHHILSEIGLLTTVHGMFLDKGILGGLGRVKKWFLCDDLGLGVNVSIVEFENGPGETTPENAETPVSGIRIRLAEPSDKEMVRDMARRFHATTPFAEFLFSERKFDRLWEDATERAKHKVALVAVRDKEVVGIAWATFGQFMLSEVGLIMTVHGIILNIKKLNGFARVKTFTLLNNTLRGISAKMGVISIIYSSTLGKDKFYNQRLRSLVRADYIGEVIVAKSNN